MTGFAQRWMACAAIAALVAVSPAAASIAIAQSSQAQSNQAPAAAPAVPAAKQAAPALPPQPPPPAAFQPGFLHQLKAWWDESAAFVDRKIKDTGGQVGGLGKKSGEATQSAAEATKEAAKDAAAVTQNAMHGAVEVTKGAAATAQDAIKSAVEATKNAATAIVKLPETRLVDVHERCEKAPNGGPDCEAAAAAGCRAKGFAGGRPLDVRSTEKCDTTSLQGGQVPDQSECPVETVVTRAACQ